MKKNIYTFLVLTVLLFVASPTLAQDNFTISMPVSNVFTLAQYDRHELIFEWIVPRNIGGDTYEGETAYEMSKWIANQSPYLRFDSWTITRGDDDYLYGYCRISYSPIEYRTMTITGLRGPSETVVLNMGGN